jgi:beta-lactamase regulating signal transducer with metallopeptidase domain
MSQLANSWLAAVNSIGAAFWDYSAAMFVQSGVLIVLLLAIDFLLRKRVRATLRYWIWMLVFVKLLLPPTLSAPTGIGYWLADRPSPDPVVLEGPSSAARPQIGAVIDSKLAMPHTEIPPTPPTKIAVEPAAPALSHIASLTWKGTVFLLWLAGVSAFSILLLRRIGFIRRLIAQSSHADAQLTAMLNRCRRELAITRTIQLRLSAGAPSPAACGLFKPTILMPALLPDKLSREKLRAVLIHELAHIKRGDLWINSTQTLLQIIYFYNPLVWLANTIVRRVREQAVDEMVLVTLGEQPKDYSNTLIDVAEMAMFKTSLSLRLIGVVESKRALHRRIRLMLNRPVPKNARLGIVGMAVIAIVAAALLPMARAEKETPNPTTQENKTLLPESDAPPMDTFTATLPDGVTTVELAGVCEHPSAGKQWWRPDGTPMETHDFRDYDYDDAVTVKEGQHARLLALKFDEDVVQDVGITWRLEGRGESRFAPDYSDRRKRIRWPVQVILAAFPDETESTDLRLGVAAGPWKTVAAGAPARGGAHARDTIAQRAVIYSEATEENGRIYISATHLVDWAYDCRIYGRGKDGEWYEPLKHSNSGSEMRVCRSEFDIPLEKVEYFHLQARPFQWVTFKSISLRRGLKTTLQIENARPDVAKNDDRTPVTPPPGKESISEKDKACIILQASVFTMRTKLSAVDEFLTSQLGAKTPLAELTDIQAKRFTQWAASVPGTNVATSPRSIVFDGQVSKMSVTTRTEYTFKLTDSPSTREPRYVQIKAGIEIEFRPYLGSDSGFINLALSIERSSIPDFKDTTDESGNIVALPAVTRRKSDSVLSIPAGKLCLIALPWMPESLPSDMGLRPARSEEQIIMLVEATVHGHGV